MQAQVQQQKNLEINGLKKIEEETKGMEVENHRQHTNVDAKEVKRKVNKFTGSHMRVRLKSLMSFKLKCKKVSSFFTLNYPYLFWVSPLSSSHFVV